MAKIPEILDQTQRLVLQYRAMVTPEVTNTIEELLTKLDRPDVIKLLSPLVGGDQKLQELLDAVSQFVDMQHFVRDQHVDENVLKFIMRAKQHKMLLRILDTLI